MPLAKLAIDTGYETAAVYAWARAQGIAQVAPVKGLEGFNRATPVSGPTFVDATVNGRKLKRGARLWTVATATFKAETYRYLRIERPSDEDRALGAPNPAGTIHLPDWADSEWLKQLVAEQLVTIRDRRGYARQEWQKMRERNEALDTRVYARAAAWIIGADRFDERMWRQLEKQAGVETAVKAQGTEGVDDAVVAELLSVNGFHPDDADDDARGHAGLRLGACQCLLVGEPELDACTDTDRLDKAAAVQRPVFRSAHGRWGNSPDHRGQHARLGQGAADPLCIQVAALCNVIGQPHDVGAITVGGAFGQCRLHGIAGRLAFCMFWVGCGHGACACRYQNESEQRLFEEHVGTWR